MRDISAAARVARGSEAMEHLKTVMEFDWKSIPCVAGRVPILRNTLQPLVPFIGRDTGLVWEVLSVDERFCFQA